MKRIRNLKRSNIAAALLLLLLGLLVPSLRAQAPISFAETQVGQSSSVQTVTVAVAPGQIGQVEVLTEGTAKLDFGEVAGGSCAAGNQYSSAGTCTVNVAFMPKYPGQRAGAVVVLNNSSTPAPMGTTYLTGMGSGALGVFVPGTAETVAGNGGFTSPNDGGPATSAELDLPFGVAMDGAGDLYIAESDSTSNRIRLVTAATQTITTFAGNGKPGYTGDGGPAANATLSAPHGLAVDGAGNLYIADSANNVIRRIDGATGVITTVVGNGTEGYAGDGGAPTAAELNTPNEIAFDSAGNLYIADTGNQRVREVSATTGLIATVAGDGTKGYAGDGAAATSAELDQPYTLAFDSKGNLYIADSGNNRVREVSARIITTVAGNGAQGFAGDGGAPTAAELYAPFGIAFDPADNLYIADTQNYRVRKVVQGVINTIVGNGQNKYGGDGGPANEAGVYAPYSVLVAPSGALYIAEYFDNRVRGVDSRTVQLDFPTAIRQGQTSAPQSQGVENDGNLSVTLAQIAPDANAAVDAATTSCSTESVLAVDEDCLVGAEFAPSEAGNPVLGNINLSGLLADTPLDIMVEGQGLALNSTSVSLLSSESTANVG